MSNPFKIGDLVKVHPEDPKALMFGSHVYVVTGTDPEYVTVRKHGALPRSRFAATRFFYRRFYLYGQDPEANQDPILSRINKLYQKCKTTKDWKVDATIVCNKQSTVS